MKAYPDLMQKLREIIPSLLSQYLIKCPNEAMTTRKELLVIMKHMIDTNSNADLRPKFLMFLDSLLDEKILLGTNKSSYESMRPLAYNTLADLIHNGREKLTIAQISKIVQFSTNIMYDNDVSIVHHILFAKLLVHLVETLFKLKGETSKSEQSEKEIGRMILLV
jgi:transformation/transcription domain-associated protein